MFGIHDLQTAPSGSSVHEQDPHIVLDSQPIQTKVVDSQTGMVLDSQPSSRACPHDPARVGFIERHLVSDLVDKLLPTCPIPGCSLTPQVEHIRESQQLWSIRIGCGQKGHDLPCITGELEPQRGSPLVTSRLYHSTLCARLTYTALVGITSHLGL